MKGWDICTSHPLLSTHPLVFPFLLSPAFQQLILFGVGILLTTYTAPNTKGP